MAELSQLALRLVAVAQRAAFIEFRDSAPKLSCGTVAVAGLSEGSTGERSRQRGLDRGTGLVCGSR